MKDRVIELQEQVINLQAQVMRIRKMACFTLLHNMPKYVSEEIRVAIAEPFDSSALTARIKEVERESYIKALRFLKEND